MVLREKRDAGIHLTSAARVGKSLNQIANDPPKELHILGVGIQCDLTEMLSALEHLKKNGCKTYWYCGWDYLDEFDSELK